MNNEERITMLREMPIPQLLIKMGLPTMIGMLVTGLYSIVDACFVGGLILSIGRQGLFFVPVILLLPHYIGLNGVIFAQPIADVFTLIAIIILATKINHEIKTLSLKA